MKLLKRLANGQELFTLHVQRSVNALADLVGNLQEEQKRQRQEIGRQRQEIDELKNNLASFNETFQNKWKGKAYILQCIDYR